ncbi:hypothetical protein RFI_35067 [Reticulomyxa filosa]|uniref:Uncharacterized protein n=1 Tax=Reticulomyxa filosa TaxID=46433 RepID=X6LKD3_RETFI|nr:hypothetical protein RFI_35067 [Reticulomyxa filosa]|eukprot:ETO02368.1 hypothetical protein RFI_35067 [Reticulomyxa filosa]
MDYFKIKPIKRQKTSYQMESEIQKEIDKEKIQELKKENRQLKESLQLEKKKMENIENSIKEFLKIHKLRTNNSTQCKSLLIFMNKVD